MNKLRIAWGITGAGDYLVESLSVMQQMKTDFDIEVTVLISKNAEMVVKWYRLWDELRSSFEKVQLEKGANVPFVAGPLQVGYYRLFFVSPATANTVAKIAYGIADSLITNCVAQATKGTTPVYIYPVDQEPGSRETRIPDGDVVTITTRKIDVENARKIRIMEGITVLQHPSEIKSVVAAVAGEAVT